MARVRLKLNKQSINMQVGNMATQSARKAAERTKLRVQANIARKGRINTGKMHDGIRVRKLNSSRPMKPRFSVASHQPYTKYQESGVKPFGPKRAQYLRFKPKHSSTYVFAKWVRGFPPGHFFRDALRSLSLKDFR